MCTSAAICYHGDVAGPYLVESLRRDWSFVNNDNFIFFLDTFDDQTNGFTFGVNAAGAQWDGLLYEGSKANLSWDNKWTSAVRNFDDRYELEIAIPFKSIRYKKGITRWGVNFSRLDLKTTEKSSWTPIPRHFPTAALALAGVLLWDEAPPAPGPNISLIPYALGGLSRDYETDKPSPARHDIGIDGKVALGSALNLDWTVNPDFSEVDVDQQVTNLDRYELFFPEKRQFFLENGDQFANFGYATIRPFFSRRIGLGGVPIRFGARLSGKVNKDWRFGGMDMQTGTPDGRALPPENFAVFALQRRVFSRSNIGILLVDKEARSYQTPAAGPVESAYNRNLGIEYNLASADNLWTGKLLYLKSFRSGREGGAVYAGHLQYNSRRWLINGQMENVDKHYSAEVGYVPRIGYHRGLATFGYTFLPEGGRILSHGPTLTSSNFFDWSGRLSDYETTLGYTVTLRNQNVFTTTTGADYVRLLDPFDPTNTGREKLAAGSVHRWKFWGTKFDSKPQSVFRYGFSSLYSGYYAGGNAAEPERHGGLPLPALCQPGRRGQLQRNPPAAALGEYAVLADRAALRCHVDEHTVFHYVRPVQRAAEEHEREHARAVALQAGIGRVCGLDRQLHARIPATGPECGRAVLGPEPRARAEVDLLVEPVVAWRAPRAMPRWASPVARCTVPAGWLTERHRLEIPEVPVDHPRLRRRSRN